jgi:hypothetical protein
MSKSEDVQGLSRLVFQRVEHEHYLLKRLKLALIEERDALRVQNDHPTDIATTTLLRGEIRLLTRILARLDEVGPESRQSELPTPESAPPAPTAGGFPVSFENDDQTR